MLLIPSGGIKKKKSKGALIAQAGEREKKKKLCPGYILMKHPDKE